MSPRANPEKSGFHWFSEETHIMKDLKAQFSSWGALPFWESISNGCPLSLDIQLSLCKQWEWERTFKFVPSTGSTETKEASLGSIDYPCALLTISTSVCLLLHPWIQGSSVTDTCLGLKLWRREVRKEDRGGNMFPQKAVVFQPPPHSSKEKISTGLPTGPALTSSPFPKAWLSSMF